MAMMQDDTPSNMATSYSPHHQHVASLIFESSARPGIGAPFILYGNDEVDVGRQEVEQALNIDDRSVSKHHLRFRCIMYGDADDEGYVPPMTYFTVLSNNSIIHRRAGLDGPSEGVSVCKGQGDVLLNSQDQIQLTQSIFITLESHDGETRLESIDHIRKAETKLFASHFKLSTRVLGWGAYASVYVALRSGTGCQLACKVVALPEHVGARPSVHDKYSREYNVLKDLSHPNIVSLEKVFRMSHSIYIFQELITGGDLLSYTIMKRLAIEEAEAAMISKQLLEAVDYLHRHNVVHRDIKPENILMTSWRKGARVVLTDFGQSRSLADVETAARNAGAVRMISTVGTHGYTAPEVFRRMQKHIQDKCGYSKAIDMWSIGCVTATMINQASIFPEHDLSEYEMSQLDARLDVLDDQKTWGHISTRAKDFLRGCLAAQEADRLTARDGLAHQWFTHVKYRDEFDAAYKRAIQDWQPRPQDPDIIETIDTSYISVEETRSHHFKAPLPRPASASRSSDQAVMIARWRPNELNASEAAAQDTASQFDEESLKLHDLSLQPSTTTLPGLAAELEIGESQDEFQDAYIDDAEEYHLNAQLYQASQNQAINRRAVTNYG